MTLRRGVRLLMATAWAILPEQRLAEVVRSGVLPWLPDLGSLCCIWVTLPEPQPGTLRWQALLLFWQHLLPGNSQPWLRWNSLHSYLHAYNPTASQLASNWSAPRARPVSCPKAEMPLVGWYFYWDQHKFSEAVSGLQSTPYGWILSKIKGGGIVKVRWWKSLQGLQSAPMISGVFLQKTASQQASLSLQAIGMEQISVKFLKILLVFCF